MKTVIVDNSLCANTLADNVSGETITGYIQYLAEAGVKYVELDFRTLMKINRLPEGIGYIFRLVDPMFMQLTEVFDFDYVLINFTDLRKKISSKVPLMLELPVMDALPGRAVRYANSLVDGEISCVRVCGSYDMFTAAEASAYVMRVKNDVPVPVDFCPRNDYKTAVDTAIKLMFAGADSLTLCTSSKGKYASFEDFVFSLLSVFDALPSDISAGNMCKASICSKYLFPNSTGDYVMSLMDCLDNDLRMLKNADTGENVHMRIRLKDTQFLHKAYISAVKKMMRKEDLSDDIVNELENAIGNSQTKVFDERILREKHKGLLN